MKKMFFLISLMLLFAVQSAGAAPAKGYLTVDEIKSILDRYSKPTKLEDVVAVFGQPTEFGAAIWSWYFEEYSTQIMFERIAGTNMLAAPKLVQMFESPYLRDDYYQKALHRLNTIFAGKIPRSGNPRRDMTLKEGTSSTTWDADENRIFSVFNYQYNGLPCLMYLYAQKDR